MQFDKFVEKILLNEMPYVLVDINDKRFDLEVEKFVNAKDLEGFIEKIKKLLNGTQLVDKYNNVAELKTEEDRKNFIENLKRDSTMPLVLWKLFVHWMSSVYSKNSLES